MRGLIIKWIIKQIKIYNYNRIYESKDTIRKNHD